jgi:hypothetical protein
VALVSLVIGLGGELFKLLGLLGLEPELVSYIKLGMFVLSLLWSLQLGERILAYQGVPLRLRWLPVIPGLSASLVIGYAWMPAIFGL